MIYIGTDQGIFRWMSGASWPVFHSLQDQRILALAAGGEGMLSALDGEGRLWETTTNGMSWRTLARPDEAGRPTCISTVAATKPALVCASAGPLQLHRRPLGVVFPEERTERPSVKSLGRIIPRRPRAGATATLEPPKRSRPSGWKPLAAPDATLAGRLNGVRALVTPSDTAAWFAAIAGDGLWRSTDAREGWTRCGQAPAEISTLRVAGEIVVAGTHNGVWISSDAGQTWTEQSSGLDRATHITSVEMRPGNPKQLLAGAGEPADGQGPVRNALYESKDGGQSWKKVTRGFPVDLESDTIIDIRHDPAAPEFAVVALASGELWKTYTDGFWWEPLARQIHRARSLCAVG